jgi:hypothetical protein
LKGRGFKVAEKLRFEPCLDSSHFLKGCGFQPHRKSRKINPALAAEATHFSRLTFTLKKDFDAR